MSIADLGSFTRAGEKLGRSQQATSLQLKRLEDLLQTRLYDRSSRELVLSSSGQRLADYARTKSRRFRRNFGAQRRGSSTDVSAWHRRIGSSWYS